MKSRFAFVCDREIHYTEIGVKTLSRRTIVMVHGFTRTCRDFDFLATFLHRRLGAHVLCPDIIGRGHSQWSPLPEDEYNPVFYGKLLSEWLSSLGVTECDYVGTSMGGLIAMLGIGLGGPLASTIKKLVLNDVGPFVPLPALGRIMAYVVNPPVAPRVSELIAQCEAVYHPFGYDLTPEQRLSIMEPCFRRLADGRVTLHYDPAIVKGIKPPPPGTPDLWFFYDRIQCPTVVVRGVDSDILLEETLKEMLERGPKPESITIQRCGHAPSFLTDEDCATLLPFFA